MRSLTPYLYLMRLNKPIGSYLLLWPTLWSMWIASSGNPDSGIVLIFVLGVWVMRSAGCVINDYADRGFDGQVKRTRTRPLAIQQLQPRQALWLFVFLLAIALLLALQLNIYSILLALLALTLTCLYPYTKRYTHWPQAFLALAFSCAILMAFAEVLGFIPPTGWLIYLANICWVIAYDTEYALADRDDDQKIGIKSTAILFGRYACLLIGLFQMLMLVLMGAVGSMANLGMYYYGALLLALALYIYQQVLLHRQQASLYLRAFYNNHYLGCTIFMGIAAHYLVES